jgi:hypothetical protein
MLISKWPILVVQISSKHESAGHVTKGLELALRDRIVLMCIVSGEIVDDVLLHAELFHPVIMELKGVVALDFLETPVASCCPIYEFPELNKELPSGLREVNLREARLLASEAQHIP